MKSQSLQSPFEKLEDKTMQAVLTLCGLVSIVTTFGIIWVLLSETLAFFAEVPLWKFVADTQWTPLFADKHFGIWALVSGTVITSAVAIATALPLGLLSAIYLSEYARPAVRTTIKPVVELLASVPTVVYGYFALSWLTPVLQALLPSLQGFNALSAGLMMGVMIIPIIASVAEDALYAVPASLREGSYALGATKLRTIYKVVLPAAFSGIVAAVLLGLSRAIGETMIVAIAAGQQPTFTFNPLAPVQTMTAYIVQVSMGDTPTGSLEYRTIFAVASCLFVFTFVLNWLGHKLRKRLTRGAI